MQKLLGFKINEFVLEFILIIISAKPTPPAGRRPAGGCVASEASEAVGEALLLIMANKKTDRK